MSPTPRLPLRVLIADDSPALRGLLRDVVSEVDGVEVVAEAQDGVEAVAASLLLCVQVLVLDLSMPRKGGIQALQEIRRREGGPRVIVLTNHAGEMYREACLTAGADHFFDKSTEIDRVLDVLRDLARPAQA